MSLISRPEVVSFFILVVLNLLIFSWFERESDHHEGQPSFAVRLGSDNTKRIIILFFGLLAILLAVTIYINQVYGFILLTMGTALAIIFLFPSYFKSHDRYRIIGDGIFILPILAVLF